MHARSFGWALACCEHRADDASDVLQEAYTKVLDGSAKFDGRSSLKTWFFGVVRLTAMEHRRSAVVRWLLPRRAETALDPSLAPSAPAEADEALANHEAARVIAAALNDLSPKQRAVVHLVFYQDLTIAEAANVMRVSLGTARLHYDRGKKNLHAILVRLGVTPR